MAKQRAPWGRPAPYRGAAAELWRWLCGAILFLGGWTVRGDWPPLPKAVLVAAPHTSNWDALYMLAAAGYFNISLQWMGKASLTQGPFGFIVKALGCVPIDRTARHDVVEAMREAFAEHETMLLAVPPEGTRGLTRVWKSGFYHIARAAGVPIILSVLDYRTKTIQIAAVFTPTGDYDTDIATIRQYYQAAHGKHRHKFTAEV
jgi:1-acyl-sn-glycerol-3-phosphate acyltransferase